MHALAGKLKGRWPRAAACCGAAALLLTFSGLTSCEEDEDEFRPRSTYAILNLLDTLVAVEFNGDPSTATPLPPHYYTIVGRVEASGSTAPGVLATPLWCLRVRWGPGGSTMWYGSEIPYNAYIQEDHPTGDRWFYLALTPEFIELEQPETRCLGTSTE